MEMLAEVARVSGRIVECKQGLSAAYDLGEIDDATDQLILRGDIDRRSAHSKLQAIQRFLGLGATKAACTGVATGADEELIFHDEQHVIVIDDDDDEEPPAPTAEKQTTAADLRQFMKSVNRRVADISESGELLLRLVPCGTQAGAWLRRYAACGVTPFGNHVSVLGDILAEATAMDAVYRTIDAESHEVQPLVAPHEPQLKLAMAVAEFSRALFDVSSSLFLHPSELTDALKNKSIQSAIDALPTSITQDHKRLILGAINRLVRCHDNATGAVPHLASLIKKTASAAEAAEAAQAVEAVEAADDEVYLAIADMVRRACLDSCSGVNRLLTREHIDAVIERGYLLHGLHSFMYNKHHPDSVLRILNIVARTVYRPSPFTPHTTIEDCLFPVAAATTSLKDALYASLTRLMYQRYHAQKASSAQPDSSSSSLLLLFLRATQHSGTGPMAVRRLAHDSLELFVMHYTAAARVPFPLAIPDLCSGAAAAAIRSITTLLQNGPSRYIPAFLEDAISEVTGPMPTRSLDRSIAIFD